MSLRHAASRHSPMKQVDGAKIEVSEVRNEGRSEAVVLVNLGHVDQPLTGWSLASLKGQRVFRFEDGFVLKAGSRVTVTSGDGVAHRPPAILGWKDEPVWNNRGDVALVFDCDGEEVARFAYRTKQAAQAGRLPKHRLVAREDGAWAIEPVRREPARERLKVTRATKRS